MNNGPLTRVRKVEHAVDDEHLKTNSRKKMAKLAQQRDIEENIEF